MSFKRFKDKPFMYYSLGRVSAEGGVWVKCPKCGQKATVTRNEYTDKHLKCSCCFHTETKSFFGYDISAKGFCMKCERYVRIPIKDESKGNFLEVHAPCPHCGDVQQWYIDKVKQQWYNLGEVNKGIESYFGCELYLLSSFRGQLMWALNDEHLDYLIEFVAAGLRERPAGYLAKKTQGFLIPTFMKTAKNRESVLRILRKLR